VNSGINLLLLGIVTISTEHNCISNQIAKFWVQHRLDYPIFQDFEPQTTTINYTMSNKHNKNIGANTNKFINPHHMFKKENFNIILEFHNSSSSLL
jgi:hypothetical protein